MQLTMPFGLSRPDFFFQPAPRSPALSGTRPLVAVWGLALWLASVGNLPLWQRIQDLGGTPTQRLESVLGLGLLLTGALVALLSLFMSARVFRPAASALVLMAAFNTHFMWQYGVVIDPTMLANVMHTDAREVRDLLSWSMPANVLLVAGLPLWALWRQPVVVRGRWAQTGRNGAGVLAGLVLVVLSALLSYQGLANASVTPSGGNAMAKPPENSSNAVRFSAFNPTSTGMSRASAVAIASRKPRPSASCLPNLLTINTSAPCARRTETSPTAVSSAAGSRRQPRAARPRS